MRRVAYMADYRRRGLGALGTDDSRLEGGPKFLDPYVAWASLQAGLSPDRLPYHTTLAETFYVADDVPTSARAWVDRMLGRAKLSYQSGRRSVGTEAITRAAQVLRDEMAKQGKDADKIIATGAGIAALVATPVIAGAVLLAWTGLKAILSFFGGKDTTEEDVARINVAYRQLVAENYPPPWGALDDTVEVPGNLADGFEQHLQKFRDLPAELQNAARAVWAAYILLLSNADPYIVPIYNGLQWHGFANEHQVMHVAFAVALSRGLEPMAFATKLFERSGGWRSRPDALTLDPSQTVIVNAGAVQWAVLAQDALALAADETNVVELMIVPSLGVGSAHPDAASFINAGAGVPRDAGASYSPSTPVQSSHGAPSSAGWAWLGIPAVLAVGAGVYAAIWKRNPLTGKRFTRKARRRSA